MNDGGNFTTCPELPSMPGVEYRHVPQFTGYCAGDDGSVWSCVIPNKKGRRFSAQWHRKRTWKNRQLYMLTSMRGDDGREHRHFVHSIVLMAFVGPRPSGFDACHFPNRDRSDNRLCNLQWGSRAENMRHAKIHGTIQVGEKNHNAKLTVLRAKAVRHLGECGWSQDDIARLFSISQPTVSSVVNKARWFENEHSH